MKRSIYTLLGLVSFLLLTSCEKFLSEKSDKRLRIPDSVQDLQALMDHHRSNIRFLPSVGEQSADDFFLPDASYNGTIADYERNLYRWQGPDVYTLTNNDWDYVYRSIYTCSVVLGRLDFIDRTPVNSVDWDNVKGQALATRAYLYLGIVTTWSKAYDAQTSTTDLGIPIRNTDNFDDPSIRPTVKENYEEIIRGLKAAIPLLPIQPFGINRPSKPMAYATLARTYLLMREYEHAYRYADSAYRLNNQLLDYNTISTPIFQEPNIDYHNPELVFFIDGAFASILHSVVHHRVDTTVHSLFEADDLRRRLFFIENADGYVSFIGNYTGSEHRRFYGISNAEVYLMLAECLARSGQVGAAMDRLNALLEKRYANNQAFVPLTATNKEDALAIVLRERRKELLFRGLRWADIKRLNKEGADITVTRKIEGQLYHLPPNDNRYALPLPMDVIELSGMPQNPQ